MGGVSRKRIAFVTAEEWRELYLDDHPAVAALTGRGHVVDAAIWDDPSIDWTAYDAVVLRSCWDYYLKPHAFAAWIDDLDRRSVRLWNPAATLRWNLDKIYLAELAGRGVRITPTIFPDRGASLPEIIRSQGWRDAVIKPRVSAAGYRTIRTSPADATTHQADLDDLLAHGGALVQQFVPQIETGGEWSFIFLGGAFSHAVRKRPAPGEFRIQVQYGGSIEPEDPGASLIGQARQVMEQVDHPWMYARVDGCDVDGRLLLMELELLEPSLYLLQGDGAADRFADAIEASLT